VDGFKTTRRSRSSREVVSENRQMISEPILDVSTDA
jgi:hypothetical protein